MPEASRKLTAFISSTSEDLRDYRAVARMVVLDMHWHPEMMEHFGALPEQTVQACYEKLASCDLMLLIVAHRRGWVPEADKGGNGTDSMTALELNFARERGIPVLAMLADDSWPGKLWEKDQAGREWVERFRTGLNLPAVFFKHEEPVADETRRLSAFRAAVRNVLIDHRERLLAREAESRMTGGLDFFDSAVEGFADGTIIPFVGHGVFGDGPLGLRALLAALGESCTEQTCLATAAEYRERFRRDRQSFLRELRRSLEEQTRNAAPAGIHALLTTLAAADRLPLIVSATYDQTLETRLTAAGKAPVVITHILRTCARDLDPGASTGQHDGKILVLRPGEKPAVCLSDQVEIQRGEFVVYKPLGSPFLNVTLDEGVEVDTVVITESDHLLFLARLDNQGTGIPTALVRSGFRRHRLLFLGYTLDVWQYRLVMQVFELLKLRAGDRTGADSLPPLAVRQPATKMEGLFWQRLNADLVQRDLGDFARQVNETLGAAPRPAP